MIGGPQRQRAINGKGPERKGALGGGAGYTRTLTRVVARVCVLRGLDVLLLGWGFVHVKAQDSVGRQSLRFEGREGTNRRTSFGDGRESVCVLCVKRRESERETRNRAHSPCFFVLVCEWDRNEGRGRGAVSLPFFAHSRKSSHWIESVDKRGERLRG